MRAAELHPVRILAPGEDVPPAPIGWDVRQVGLTAHLRRQGAHDAMACGVPPGMRPAGAPLGVCVDCWAIAR